MNFLNDEPNGFAQIFVNEANRRAVTTIVEKLDRVSLAIELAAARIRVMSPSQISERLGQRFEFLNNPEQEISERQATLSGVIDWSWKLLSLGRNGPGSMQHLAGSFSWRRRRKLSM